MVLIYAGRMVLRQSSIVALTAVAIWAMSAHALPASSLRVQVVDERGAPVRGAVVELDTSASTTGPVRFSWRMAMAQKGLQFTPGTLVVAKGATVAFPNLDQVRHSIYSFSKPARFSIDLYGRDQTRTQTFPITGSVAIGCNIHDQMRGYIRVVDTPYAGKTDGNGLLMLTSLPSGPAKLTVWHPSLKAPGNQKVQSVSVDPGEVVRKVAIRLR
jgi:plastocyanin